MLSGAGVFWINSGVNDDAVLPYADFVRWYEDVHIPDVIQAPADGPLPVARRYEAIQKIPDGPDGSDELDRPDGTPKSRPFLVVYTMPDLSFAGSDAFRSVPIHHSSLPEGGPIARFASFHARFGRHVETWGRDQSETKSAEMTAANASLLLSEVVELVDELDGGEAVLHQWYRDEYMPEVAQLPGWIRSTRFGIVLEHEIRGGHEPGRGPGPPPPPGLDGAQSKAPKWLTLHEFDITKAGVEKTEIEILAKHPTGDLPVASEVTRRMADKVTVEMVSFQLARTYGDGAVTFCDAEETTL